MKPNRVIPGNTHLLNSGMVVSVRGSVVDIVFEERLPPIHSLMHTGTENQIAIEVFSQLDAHRVRGIALTPTQGLARGMVVIDTCGPLQAPVGKGILSRMFDVFGNTIDRQAAPSDVQWRTVHRAPPSLARRSTKSELFETGIKVIDVLMPLERGGKAGLFGGGGCGQNGVAHRIGIVYEIEEQEIARIQEVSFEVSSDSGAYFREILRQEYNFSPDGCTLQREEMKLDLSRNTDLKMTIKPDKGNLNCLAKLNYIAFLA